MSQDPHSASQPTTSDTSGFATSWVLGCAGGADRSPWSDWRGGSGRRREYRRVQHDCWRAAGPPKARQLRGGRRYPAAGPSGTPPVRQPVQRAQQVKRAIGTTVGGPQNEMTHQCRCTAHCVMTHTIAFRAAAMPRHGLRGGNGCFDPTRTTLWSFIGSPSTTNAHPDTWCASRRTVLSQTYCFELPIQLLSAGANQSVVSAHYSFVRGRARVANPASICSLPILSSL